LALNTGNDSVSAEVFLFDANGKVIRLISGPIIAGRLAPASFVAPQMVAGFYLQIRGQSLNRSSSDPMSQLDVSHIERGSFSTLDVGPGENLIDISGLWPHWNAQPTGVVLSNDGSQLDIPAPDQGNRIGVKRFAEPLKAGNQYQWAMAATQGAQSGPSALLFLFDSQYRTIPFAHPDSGHTMPWLTARATESTQFVAPADVIGYAVQVQSGWNASTSAGVIPALTRISGEDPVPDPQPEPPLEQQLLSLLASTNSNGVAGYLMPEYGQFNRVPAHPDNPITDEKVQLGAMLFHETALATVGNNADRVGTWSCASCHQVAAGFKAGVAQGIGEGGDGFGVTGEGRFMAPGFDATLPEGDPFKPDVQPLASPTAMNTAYQDVMLWNGQFGNSAYSSINLGIDPSRLMTPGTPKEANINPLPGVEIQAIAGLGVHRLNVVGNSVLQTNPRYRKLFEAAYPAGSDDEHIDAAKAIAAYERILLPSAAPFQRWLKGEPNVMSESELRGAVLFFGEAGCAACHRGPALSSEVGANADEVFMSIGMADFDMTRPDMHGVVTDADSRGRGGFTGNAADNHKFKIPQLYNLADANIMGHGSSFTSIRDVVLYKNEAIAQNPDATNLDERFIPLGLSDAQITDLTAFLTDALRDPDMIRYVPRQVPSGQCFPVADDLSMDDLGC
jgi:cytochrome c peroxidase